MSGVKTTTNNKYCPNMFFSERVRQPLRGIIYGVTLSVLLVSTLLNAVKAVLNVNDDFSSFSQCY